MSDLSRRQFLRSGAAAAAAATAITHSGHAEPSTDPTQDASKSKAQSVLPTRALGKTGREVTMLGQGGAFLINERHLNMLHDLGIRYIDTAKYYFQQASERAIADWFGKTGRRKEYFLVTKDIPKTPEEMLKAVDERLEVLKTDYLDTFFLHGFGDADFFGLEPAKEVLASKEWAAAADKLRNSGKCRFVGFSSHTEPIEVRSALLQATAKAGWIDHIMVAADPLAIRENAEFNKALDACHQAGIGLVSMKECRGQGKSVEERKDSLHEMMTGIFPSFGERGLSPFTAVITAMWSDERFACVCSHMDTLEKLSENTTACRNFKPMSEKEVAAVVEMIRSTPRTYCVACDGSCRRAAGTEAELNTIARYVTYAEQDGRVYEARDLLNRMDPRCRDWSGADLDAAQHACKCHVDYPAVIRRAEELLA